VHMNTECIGCPRVRTRHRKWMRALSCQKPHMIPLLDLVPNAGIAGIQSSRLGTTLT
jgi:predicted Fe-S protein YdhL (DUF1289 family)